MNNANLSMSTLHTARRGPQQLAYRAVMDQAVGVLAAQHGISVAEGAGISEQEVAGAIVRSLGT